MDDFTKRYLLCESTPATDPDSTLSCLAFKPGPPIVREPLFVADLQHSASYCLSDVLATFAALPNVNQKGRDAGLRWTLDDRWIELSFVGEGGEWTESPVQCWCTFADLAWMWLSVCRKHRTIMLQNAHGRLFTPRSFLHELAFPRLSDAFDNSNASTSQRAELEMSTYRVVARDALH